MILNVSELCHALAELAPHSKIATAWLIRLQLAEGDEERDQVVIELLEWFEQIAAAFDELKTEMLEWARKQTRVGGPV